MRAFQLISDLHFEFFAKVPPSVFARRCVSPRAPVLALCGDVGVVSATELDKLSGLMKEFKTMFRHVLWVPGNHEYYGSPSVGACNEWMQTIASDAGVHLLNNAFVELEDFAGVRFIGSTLWSNVPQQEMFAIKNCIADYHYIKFANGVKLTPNHTNGYHEASVGYLDRTLAQCASDGKKAVVLTHHMPSMRAVAPKFENSPLTSAFASSQDGMMKKHRDAISHWAFGHTHSSVDLVVEGVHLVCNPRGYPRSKTKMENESFDMCKTFEVV